MTLTDVNVVNCSSGGDGGGIYNTAPLTLTASIISGNTATANGGGIYASALMTIAQTTIGTIAGSTTFATPNHAENGGGIFDTGLHTTTISGSAIVGNTATGGGALAGRSTTIDVIENSTISANVARDTAGGITTNGRVTLKNVTISGNRVEPTSTSESTTSGVGISSFGSGSYTFVNTIFSNNVVVGTTNTLANCGVTGSGSGANFFVSSGHNLEDGDSCNLTGQGDLKNTDPQLAALANNGGLTDTMAIAQASPAIDAGDNTACPNNDQRGDLRPADGNIDGTFVCDIGAFELFVHTADVHIDNMTAPDTAFTTDPITVTIAVHNDPSATTTATGVQITTAALPAGFALTTADVTTPGGTAACTVASAVVTCPVGSLAVGEAATATLVGTATAPGELAFTATVSSTAPIDPNTGNNTATVRIAVTGNADMGVTATGATGTVNAGTHTDLSFTVTNNGPDPANNARVAAFLPAGLTYQSIAISQGTCTVSSTENSVTCAIGAMAAGATVTGTLTVQGSVDGPVSTLFGVAADERDQQPDNDTATVALQLLGLADLQLAMSAGTTFPTVGQTVPVTLTVSNLSGADTRNVVETVTLPAGATFVAAATGSACTASGATVTCTLGGVRVGAQATTAFDIKVASAGVSTLSGTVKSDLVDPVAANNTASLQLTVVSADTGGGGGCAYRPGGTFDPTLLGLLMTGLIGLAARRGLRREATRK